MCCGSFCICLSCFAFCIVFFLGFSDMILSDFGCVGEPLAVVANWLFVVVMIKAYWYFYFILLFSSFLNPRLKLLFVLFFISFFFFFF